MTVEARRRGRSSAGGVSNVAVHPSGQSSKWSLFVYSVAFVAATASASFLNHVQQRRRRKGCGYRLRAHYNSRSRSGEPQRSCVCARVQMAIDPVYVVSVGQYARAWPFMDLCLKCEHLSCVSGWIHCVCSMTSLIHFYFAARTVAAALASRRERRPFSRSRNRRECKKSLTHTRNAREFKPAVSAFCWMAKKLDPNKRQKCSNSTTKTRLIACWNRCVFMRANVYAQWRLSSPLCTRLLLLRMRSCLLGISLFLRPCVRLYRLFVAVNTLTAFRIVPANERIDRRILLNVMGTQEVYLFWQNF
jgi:hypothetical protein